MVERTKAQQAAYDRGYADRKAHRSDFVRRGYSLLDGTRKAYMDGRRAAAIDISNIDRAAARGDIGTA